MNLRELNNKIESSYYYQFTQRHKKVINVIQGLIIISLLISINIYVVKDHFIKKQIAENCGYTTSKITCVCEKNYFDNWQEMNSGNYEINLTGVNDVSMDR